MIEEAIKSKPSKRNSDNRIECVSNGDEDNIIRSNRVVKEYISQVDEFINLRKKSTDK